MATVKAWNYGEVFVAREGFEMLWASGDRIIRRRSFDPADGILVEAHADSANVMDTAGIMRCISLDQSTTFGLHAPTQILRRATAKETKQYEREVGKAFLLKMLKPGNCIYTLVVQSSKQSFSRRIKFFIAHEETAVDGITRPVITNITAWVARAFGDRINRNDGGLVCNENGHATVEHLSWYLFPDGMKADSRNGGLKQQDL